MTFRLVQPRLRLPFLLLAFIACALSTSAATEWFVAPAPAGNDNNPGTSALPFATFEKANSRTLPGDTVSIKAGTYLRTRSFIPTMNANNRPTAAAPITYRAVGGEVIIDGQFAFPTTYLWDGVIEIQFVEHFIFEGLTVINGRFFGFHIESADHITIRNCSTIDTWGSGIRTWDSSFITITGNSIRRACTLPLWMQPNGRINTQECISINTTTDFEVAYNVVFDRLVDDSGGGEGIDVKGICARGTVHHNVVYDLYRLGIYVDAFDDDIDDIAVYNNTVFRCSSGIVLAYEDQITGSVRNIRIHDNLIYDISGTGIRIAGYLFNGPIHDIEIYNNTVANTGTGLYLEASHPQSGNFVIRNNLFYDNPTQVRIRQQIIDRNLPFTIDNNLFYTVPRTGVTVPALPSRVTNSLIADPRFVDVAAKNFALAADSPAIDRAVAPLLSSADYNGAPRPLDGNADGVAAVDLGAFEFVPAFTQPTDGVARAYFTDGNGPSTPQQFPGSPGDGWTAGWTLSAAATATTENSAPLSADTGNYLKISRTGGTLQEGISRPWSATVRPFNQPARLTFQIRLDSPLTTFDSAADTLTIASRSGSAMGGGADATFFIRAFGGAAGTLGAREWGVYDGQSDTTSYSVTRFRPTGVLLSPGTTYSVLVDLYAGTYDVTISGGGQSGTVTGLAFRTAATTLGGFLTFASEQNNILDNLAFAVDSIELRAIPTPQQAWRLEKFETTENLGDAADLADPDFDGINNLFEYALGGEPLTRDTSILPVVSASSSSLTLTFLRARADLTYVVQGSSDLAAPWADLVINPGTVSNTTPVIFTEAITNPTHRFLRLRVTTP